MIGVSLESGCNLSAAGCEFTHGECNKKTGRGGALYVKSTEADPAGQTFLLKAVTFESNDASKGRNIYVYFFNINTSISPTTFHLMFQLFINDPHAFVGSDQTFADADLFRFLFPYASSEIHLPDAGFEIARCGSPIEPFRSFVAGFEHMDASASHKTFCFSCPTHFTCPEDLPNFIFQLIPTTKQRSQCCCSRKIVRCPIHSS